MNASGKRTSSAPAAVSLRGQRVDPLERPGPVEDRGLGLHARDGDGAPHVREACELLTADNRSRLADGHCVFVS